MTQRGGGSGQLSVWLLTDDKPGHRNQLLGLLQALEDQADVESRWLQVGNTGWLDVLLGRHGPTAGEAPPDLLLAAGRRTHREALALRRSHRCYTAILMRPSLPLVLFDASIIPAHDNPDVHNPRIMVTRGALNAVRPATASNPETGLILLGGTSPHFRFDPDAVTAQVARLLEARDDLAWTVTDSRRTPEGTLRALAQLGFDDVELRSHESTPPGWIETQLQTAGQVWVTPDSVSMVYEALSAGIPTGLLPLPALGRGRVQQGVEDLREQGWLNDLDQVLAGKPLHSHSPLQEAQRAASWLLQRLGRVPSR